MPKSRLTSDSICNASSELPLRSKKLSRVPTGSTPITSDHNSASARSVAVSGGVYGCGSSGRGKRSAGALVTAGSAVSRGSRSVSPPAATSTLGAGWRSRSASAARPCSAVIECAAMLAPTPSPIRCRVADQVSQCAAIQRVPRGAGGGCDAGRVRGVAGRRDRRQRGVGRGITAEGQAAQNRRGGGEQHAEIGLFDELAEHGGQHLGTGHLGAEVLLDQLGGQIPQRPERFRTGLGGGVEHPVQPSGADQAHASRRRR